jgi:hypothetical protein
MELSEGKTLPLRLQSDGGETKSMASVKLGSFVNLDMDINVTCINEVHGYLDGTLTQCASLIVLRFNLGSRATGRRFLSFRPLITVHNSPRSKDEADEPWITDCIEPGEGNVHISEFFSRRSKKTSLGVSLKVSPPDPVPVGGDLSWAREDSEDWKETYRYTVQATRREQRPGRRNKDDQIYWNAAQGKLIRSGIDMLQVAFVVLRKPGYDLELKFELDSDVGFKYKFKKGWKNFWNLPGSTLVSTLKVYDDAVLGDASAVRKLRDTTMPEGIERDYLRKLESTARPAFQKLAWVHDIEAMEPVKFYGKGKSSTLLF